MSFCLKLDFVENKVCKQMCFFICFSEAQITVVRSINCSAITHIYYYLRRIWVSVTMSSINRLRPVIQFVLSSGLLFEKVLVQRLLGYVKSRVC